MKIGNGALYIDGKKIVEISSAEISEAPVISDPVEERTISLNEEFSLTCEVNIDRLTMLSVLYGFNVSNNWLKMHGGIMTRKGMK